MDILHQVIKFPSNACIRKEKGVKSVSYHLKKLEKEEQIKVDRSNQDKVEVNEI